MNEDMATVLRGINELAGALHTLAAGQEAGGDVDMASVLRLLARHAETLQEALEEINSQQGGNGS